VFADVGRHVYLVFSRSEHPYVSELAAYLTSIGLGVRPEVDGSGQGDREAVAASAVVVVVVTPSSLSSDRVQDEVRHATDLQKPVLPMRLETCPPRDIPLTLRRLHFEDVTGGRMPGASFVEQLFALTAEPTSGTADGVASPPIAELIGKYLPARSATRAPRSSARKVSLPASVSVAQTVTRAEDAPFRRRTGVGVSAIIVGLVAAAGLVWSLVNQLPDGAGGSPNTPVTPAQSPTAAVNAFIAAAEVRHDDAVKVYVCQRYQDAPWYAPDFYAPNFLQAKLAQVTEQGDSAIANIELNFQVDGDSQVKGVQYSVVKEDGSWRVCGPT
jgi:TIR domain